jgi:hypothetical protein
MSTKSSERGVMTSWSGQTFLVWGELTERERSFMLTCRGLTVAQRAELLSFGRHLAKRKSSKSESLNVSA